MAGGGVGEVSGFKFRVSREAGVHRFHRLDGLAQMVRGRGRGGVGGLGRWDRGRGGGRYVRVTGGGGGEAGVLEEVDAGESCDGGVFGFGEFAEALDGHGEVGLGEEAGLLSEELGAEGSVGFVLSGEEEVLGFFVGEVELGEGVIKLLRGVSQVVVDGMEGFGARGGEGREFRIQSTEFKMGGS